MKRFFLVWRDSSHWAESFIAPEQKYDNESDAIACAERCAADRPGQKFYVLAAVSLVTCPVLPVRHELLQVDAARLTAGPSASGAGSMIA